MYSYSWVLGYIHSPEIWFATNQIVKFIDINYVHKYVECLFSGNPCFGGENTSMDQSNSTLSFME